MDKTIITIPGNPIPLKRPRLGRYHTYDSQAEIKEAVHWIVKSQAEDEPPPTGPIDIEISFFMPIPRSMSKKKKASLPGQPHIKRPDIDNLIKFYLDVCNKTLYEDDAQIYTLKAIKTYSNDPHTYIEITEGGTNGN